VFFHLFTFYLSLISILIYILFFIQIFLILFNTSYKFSFVNLIDFCCSFLLLGIPIFMPLLEHLFTFVSVIVKFLKKNCLRGGSSTPKKQKFTIMNCIAEEK
jgi:hypothetical protein